MSSLDKISPSPSPSPSLSLPLSLSEKHAWRAEKKGRGCKEGGIRRLYPRLPIVQFPESLIHQYARVSGWDWISLTQIIVAVLNWSCMDSDYGWPKNLWIIATFSSLNMQGINLKSVSKFHEWRDLTSKPPNSISNTNAMATNTTSSDPFQCNGVHIEGNCITVLHACSLRIELRLTDTHIILVHKLYIYDLKQEDDKLSHVCIVEKHNYYMYMLRRIACPLTYAYRHRSSWVVTNSRHVALRGSPAQWGKRAIPQ